MSFKIASPTGDHPKMFVCICRGVSLNAVHAAVEAGAETPEAVEAACGAGGDCGTCVREVAEVIRERRGRTVTHSQAA
jgi:bacterioferritin-associated ferredoxin